MTAVVGLVAIALPDRAQRRILAGVFVALAGQLVLGGFDWFYRYEAYAAAFGVLIIAAVATRAPQYVRIAAAVAIFFNAFHYLSGTIEVPQGSRNIFEQQFQMHRFVNDFYKKSVAVNDLGWISYRQKKPFYVLDLAGLASNEALRQTRKDAAWLDDVTRRKNVGLAMIYPDWFESIPASWTKIGTISFSGPAVSAAERTVFIYATAVGNPAEIKTDFQTFIPTLPKGVAAVVG